MEIKGIKWTAPFFDGSGYAEASRQYVLALHKQGIPLTLEPVSFEDARPDLGPDGNILQSLVDKDIEYNIKVIMLTPEHYPLHREGQIFNIGYSFWETTKLCNDWLTYINDNVQVCWVSCSWNAEVYKNSGITVPIYTVWQGYDPEDYKNIGSYSVAGVNNGAYKFYSVFQWTERKHPMALIKAYWSAFREKDNVALILKTYRSDYTDGQKNLIKDTIRTLKHIMPMPDYPRIYLVLSMLSKEQMVALHQSGDCFVLLQRGEGWGLPHFEAGILGKPVLTTGLGGQMDFLSPDNSYLVNYTLTPVFGMPWCPWYVGDQWWAEPDVFHAAQLMRHIYENQKEAAEKGSKLQQFITGTFKWEDVGKRVLEIIRGL